MKKSVLIIGGSPAGLQAELDLADSGIEVHIAETSPFIGDGRAAGIPGYLLNARALEIAKHPRVTLWTHTDLQHVSSSGDSLQIQLLRQPRFVDLMTCTACGDCIEACPVTVPETQHRAVYRLEGVQPQCAVIDKAGIAPCANACPAGIHVQGYVALIADGRFQEAINLVREAIPFPAICGRICTHPCETECRRNEIDQPVAIRQLKRFIADWESRNAGSPTIKAQQKLSPDIDGKRIAVVGAGPAGLTAAYYLVRRGHSVTVFEKLPIAGGMMAVGIPAFRLPKDILRAEISVIEQMGVELKTGVTFGKDITLDQLKSDGFQAVFLATGLHGSHKLGIAGEDLPGVLDGVTFLKNVALGNPVALGHRIIVVGGGNVAIDVALTARRLDCDEVTMVCLEKREEMPAWDFEIEEALEAGVEIVNCFGPNRFVEKNGIFAGIEFKRCTCVFDDQCNFNPQYDETDLNTLAAQNAIVAIGQKAALNVNATRQIACSPRGEIIADPISWQTNIPWVFAGGDAVYGPQSVVEAIASGKQAAESIHRYLTGYDLKAGRRSNRADFRWQTAAAVNSTDDRSVGEAVREDYQIPIAQRPLSDAQRIPKPREQMPVLSLAERQSCFAEVELGYSQEQALIEARRCLVCGPCSECMACVEVCKPLAINHEQQARAVELDVGAIIYADDPRRFERLPETPDESIYRVLPENVLLGSATAAWVMSNWPAVFSSHPAKTELRSPGGSARIGVFICRCGEAIAQTVDVEALHRQTATLADVICVQVLPFSCTPEADQTMAEMVSSSDLSQVVLAACACCNLDQVCFSCTYQRVRCKQNLGLFDSAEWPQLPNVLKAPETCWPVRTEFVNIREQCAWVHPNDPAEATAKAAALIAAAVAKLRRPTSKQIKPPAIQRSALILGSGEASGTCREHLGKHDIITRQLDARVARIWRTAGRFAVRQNGDTWTAESIVLAPRDPLEADGLITTFGTDAHRPRIRSRWGGLETHLPGVFYCEPATDSSLVGAAAAARVCAWLGRCSGRVNPNIAVVDEYRCRACHTCMDICVFGAPQLVGQESDQNAWIDPYICTGCGTCAAHCPSGAISAGYASDEQLAAMIEAILADGEQHDGSS